MLVKNNNCRICKSGKLKFFLDLGNQPLANSFPKKDNFTDEKKFPLEVYFCEDCNLAQLVHIVDKEVLFRDYIYFSSGMPKLSDHFRNYAEDIMKKFLTPGDLVVELASNDGILLKFFKDRGYKTLGVDPASNIAPLAEKLGVKTINDFFSAKLSEEIARDYGKAKVIMANNVVAHINDHHDLVQGISNLLDENGVFVLEAPYLIDMFENLSYDTIYHEHLSFLAVRPLQVLFAKFGLKIIDVEIHPVQGFSIRVFVAKEQSKYEVSKNVFNLVNKELALGLDKFESYLELARRVENSKNKLLTLLRDLKSKGKTIAAYGAPAKGNTILNYVGIGTDILDYALDDLPSKQGLFTPGMHIPVVNRDYAKNNPPDYYLLLAWNYQQAILEKETEFRNRGGKFIVPIGDDIQIK